MVKQMKYINKSQLIREIDDELALIDSGRTCCSRHIKILCRNRTNYLKWKMNRIEKDKDFDNPPSTVTIKPSVIIIQKYR